MHDPGQPQSSQLGVFEWKSTSKQVQISESIARSGTGFDRFTSSDCITVSERFAVQIMDKDALNNFSREIKFLTTKKFIIFNLKF